MFIKMEDRINVAPEILLAVNASMSVQVVGLKMFAMPLITMLVLAGTVRLIM